MQELLREQLLNHPAGVRVDAVLGDSIFEVIADARDLRQLRAKLMEMAQIIQADIKRRVILVLDDPRISRHRLEAEWHQAAAIMRPEIFRRLSLVLWARGTIDAQFGEISSQERDAVEQLVQMHDGERSRRLSFGASRRPEAFYEILRVLLILWFRRNGPVTSATLMAMAGCSYPTLATALRKLEPCLKRQSDRRIELSKFPRDAWFELVSLSEKVRSPRRYVDRSSKHRSPESMIRRLMELKRDDIAVGGVLGARHHLPKLDLVGTPRLDLTVCFLNQGPPEAFIRHLDAALVPAERNEPPQVVVHTVIRKDSLFERDDTGHLWADQVECLLDLHEAHLEAQALEMLDALTPKP
jgi:hypothetical protein